MMNSFEQQSQQEKVAPRAIVSRAIEMSIAYHEDQLKKMNALLNGENPAGFESLVDQYHQFLEANLSPEAAFVAFLQHLQD